MPTKTTTGRGQAWNRTYPWEKWFARTIPVRLRKGSDYKIGQAAFAQVVRNAATKFGAKVSLVEHEDGLGFTLFVREKARA